MKSIFLPPDCFYKVGDGFHYQASSGWHRPERRHTHRDIYGLVLNCDSKLKNGSIIKPLISHIYEYSGYLSGKKCHELAKHYSTGQAWRKISWTLVYFVWSVKPISRRTSYLLGSSDLFIFPSASGTTMPWIFLVPCKTILWLDEYSKERDQFEYYYWGTCFCCIRTHLQCLVWPFESHHW